MRKFATNILIRNNRLSIIENNGLIVNYKVLSDSDYLIGLKKKLLEGVQEVFGAENIQDLKLEIIDAMEVLEYLIELYSIDEIELKQIKKDKQIKIGKFDKKIKTYLVEMLDSHEELLYYLLKPNKYLEIKE